MSLKWRPADWKKQSSAKGGYTLIELMLAVTIMAIITPAITELFLKVQQGMAADEMHTQLKTANQQLLNQLHERLSVGARIFQNDTFGPGMMAKAVITTAPAVLTGSHLPVVQPNDSLSPQVSGFVAADVGNEIFFAANDSTQTITSATAAATIYPAPMTLTNVLDSTGLTSNARTVVVNLYRFYYYYLTAVNPHGPGNTTTYQLVEWQSKPVADYNQLNGISDATLLSNAISQLTTPVTTTLGNYTMVNGGLSYSWDDSAANAVTSFYTLTTSTPYQVQQASVNLAQAQYNNMVYVPGGILTSGYKWGIPPNAALYRQNPFIVPTFGTASGSFPGGFEVELSGNGAGRQALVHNVLIGQGATAPNVIYSSMTNVTSVRDVW